MNLDTVIQRCQSQGYTISDRLIKIVDSIDRSIFVESKYQERATDDNPLPIPNNQTISAPHMVLMMLADEALDVHAGDKVLEIGTGSGYNAAILTLLVGENGKLITIERHAKLVEFARNNMINAKIPLNYEIIHGDGTLGLSDMQFDRIIVTASGPYIPDTLIEQLKSGGKMVIPVKSRVYEILLRVEKIDSTDKSNKEYMQRNSEFIDKIRITDLGGVRFVPLVGKYGH